MNINDMGNIYIPDISGFSNFVNDIEILHGQEITGELIEEIIDSNDLGLEVSEIEGDAVLFFKLGEPIPFNKIHSQSIITLERFKYRVDEIQKKLICKCNACSSVNNLSLKFIFHYDNIKVMNIKNFKKLFGSGVILAHRLLKNNLKEKEYIIFTKKYFDLTVNEEIKLYNNTPSIQFLESFGEIECYHLKLS